MPKNPVVIYGASGYTGRLVAEYLREYQVPFVAAGRNKQRIEEAMKVVPGIETAEYEVVEVEHTVEALTELFSGARVVCATVGPFARFGTEVVKASLDAGCHYLDSTGEQEWMIEMRDAYGDAFAEKGLLLCMSSAYMYGILNIAAELCLEVPGIDSLDAVCVPTGVPTVGSTQTVMELAKSKQCWLENNELVEIVDANLQASEVSVPGQNQTVLTLPWGGGCLPLWYADDSRVRNVKSLTGFTNRRLMEAVIEVSRNYNENIKHLPPEEQIPMLDAIAESFTPGMPPRENRNIHRTVDRVQGVGNNKQVCCTIVSNSPYLQTGLIEGFMASQLVNGKPNAVGFQSPTNAVGHHELLAALQAYGFCNSVKIETI